jgi:hypothetical protein
MQTEIVEYLRTLIPPRTLGEKRTTVSIMESDLDRVRELAKVLNVSLTTALTVVVAAALDPAGEA